MNDSLKSPENRTSKSTPKPRHRGGPISHQKARTALWERGNLSWKLHDGQRVIEKAYAGVARKLFVANCARRFGKTFWACVKAVECALACKNPMPRIKYASATRVDLKEFVIPAFTIIFQDCPPELMPEWKATDSKFVFPHNGAEIQLIGLDKRPDGGRGNYCDLYIFEEAGFISRLEYLYGSVVAPMTLRRPGARIIMISTPPETPAHPFQEFCRRALFQNAYAELNIYQNPMLSKQEVEEARAECLDESEWFREYLCQFVVDASRAIIPEWNQNYVGETPLPSYERFLHRYVSMDLGVKVDLTAVLFGYYDPKTRELIIEDEAEINGPQMTTIGLRDLVRAKEEALWGKSLKPYRRVADNDNPLLIQDLGNLHGLHFVPTGKDSLHAMVNEVRLLVKQGRIKPHPRCEKLIGCLRYGIWNKKRDKFDRSTLYGHFDHLAALIYMVRNLDQNTDPVPSTLGQDPIKQHLRQRRRRGAKEAKLKRIFNI